MKILGIETSCDETAAAIVENGQNVLSSVVASQEKVHERFGGVVPELASRNHIANILPVIEGSLSQANLSLSEVDGIAVTQGPGLIGSLLVGVSVAKSIAFAQNLPWVGVHHVEGHIAAGLLQNPNPDYPVLGLVVSGGHTSLFRIPAPGHYECIGRTRDDAAGEAFDKVAKLCNLGFPGGPALEKASKGGNPKAVMFPRPSPEGLDFSFSGLKTSVSLRIQKQGQPQGSAQADLLASFQEAVVDVLIDRTVKALQKEKVKTLVVCGGVACNQRLRERLQEVLSSYPVQLLLAPPQFCTDNAAMIAAAGYPRLAKGQKDPWNLNARATIPIFSQRFP